jgi:uncharacterized protein with NRDE domain
MCTLIVGQGLDRRWPLLVAANRDEALGRPSEGWTLRTGPGGLRYAAPGDLLAGGTWMGLSAGGLFAAVTNYHAPLDWYPDPARRSRGELVPLALAAGDVEGAARAAAAQRAEGWNPFHLVVADGAGALLWWYDGERSGLERLGPGLHVVTESDREGRGPRAERVRARWPTDPSPARLREVLTQHARGTAQDDPPAGAARADLRDATCIHGDPRYGTRSSVILRLAAQLSASELFVSDVRPCLGPHEDRSALLAELARGAAARG